MSSARIPVIALLGLCLFAVVSPGQDPCLVPWPQKIQVQAGRLALTPGSRIVTTDAQLKPLAAVLASEVEACFGLKPELAGKQRSGDIVLKVDPSLKGEAHEVQVADVAGVRGGNYQAVAAGTATLLQAIEAGKDRNLSLPKVTIRDEPAHAYRGVMIDVARRNNSIRRRAWGTPPICIATSSWRWTRS